MEQSSGDAWTVQRLLDWTVKFFETKGIETARLDAELLLAHALGWQRIELYARYDHVPQGPPLDQFREMVRSRGARMPARYLTGKAEFYSLPLAVSPAVLIPRPETEFLVERALAVLPKDDDSLVADLGTGSGAIALAVAKGCAKARVVATDVSEDALAVARANAEKTGLAERVTFALGFWFEALEDGARFDAILSNPPYVAVPDLEQAMPEVRDHEPRLALDGGDDGLDAYRLLVAEAATWLRPGAWLILEVGQGQSEAVLALASETGRYDATAVEPDYQGIPRVVSLQCKA